MMIPTSDEIRLRARSLNRGLFNPPTLHRRHFDGVLVTMHQSGSHWLKYMLSLILTNRYDLPPLAHISDHSIVGTPIYPQIPQITFVHSTPHYLLRSRTFLKLLRFPKYVILVRDIRDGLVAHYEKFKKKYPVDFSTYLRGDVSGHKYRDDIWLRIRFLNGWGPVVERNPERIAVVKYEDLIADTCGQVARVCDHFGIEGVTPRSIEEAVAAASKTNMAKAQKPNWKRSLVRMDPRPSNEWYSEGDRRFVSELCRRNLTYTFGYRYW